MGAESRKIFYRKERFQKLPMNALNSANKTKSMSIGSRNLKICRGKKLKIV